MADYIFIGTMPNQQHQAHATARQAEANERLQQIHPDEVGPQLTGRLLSSAASHLLAVINRLPPEHFVETAKDLVVPSFAVEQFAIDMEAHKPSISNLGWLLPAQWALNQIANEAEVPASIVESTWFFSKDHTLLRKLGSVAKGEIEPAGAYTRPAFVAGVAVGEIGRSPHTAETLADAMIASRAA